MKKMLAKAGIFYACYLAFIKRKSQQFSRRLQYILFTAHHRSHHELSAQGIKFTLD